MSELSDEAKAALLDPNQTLDQIITREVIRRLEADPEFIRMKQEEAEEIRKMVDGDPSKARPMGVINFPARPSLE